MLVAQLLEVHPRRDAVHDAPLALDHHAVRGMRAAEDERRDRIAGAGEAQLVEGPEGEVGLLADRDRADADNAALIARLRVSAEGQEGLGAFLEKRAPAWTPGL